MTDLITFDDSMTAVMQELFGLTYEEACQQAAGRGVYRHDDIRLAMTPEAYTALDTTFALSTSALQRNLTTITSPDEAYQIMRNIARVYRLTHGGKFQMWRQS